MNLQNIPMPPTANRQVMPSRGRLIKTNAARHFDTMIAQYRMANFRAIEEISNKVTKLIKDGFLLQAHYLFCFPKDRLFTKKNEIKRLDSTNRLKSAEDAVSKILNIDDKYFIKNTTERAISCKSLNGGEYFNVLITPTQKISQETMLMNSLISLQLLEEATSL